MSDFIFKNYYKKYYNFTKIYNKKRGTMLYRINLLTWSVPHRIKIRNGFCAGAIALACAHASHFDEVTKFL